MHVEVFEAYKLVAEFDVDTRLRSVSNYKKYTNDWLLWPFTKKDIVDYEHFIGFLETRCPDRNRDNLKELLRDWGIFEFDPIAIIRITHGLSFDDWTWIRFEGDDATYDSIKVRTDLPADI